ncbi:MAG TPA: hypothetical protein EYP18_02575 [Desulfobacterales bacterium]|nr:hypothetical protein [Desulfobacterales bacterium]
MLRRKRDLGYDPWRAPEMEEDELARLIRVSLQECVAGSHPSPQVWVNIKAELARLPGPLHRNARTSSQSALGRSRLTNGARAFTLRVMELFTPTRAALPRLLQSAVTLALLIAIFTTLFERPLSPWGGGAHHQGEVSPAAFSAVQDTLSMAYLMRQHREVTTSRSPPSTVRRADDPFSSPRFERIRNGVGVLPQEGDDVPLFLPHEEHLSMVQMAQEAYLSQIREARVLETLATPISLDRRMDLGGRPDALDKRDVFAIMISVERLVYHPERR